MFRFISIILFGVSLMGFHPAALADGDIMLKGLVRDAYNKSALADAHVIIEELQTGTITNHKGIFIFSRLAPGTYHLKIMHIGYLEYNEVIELDSAITELTILVRPRVFQIDPVTITATLNKRKLSVMPARLAVISAGLIEQLPANNTDDLLSGVANVYVHRPWGIFSKSASVSMRGLPGSARSLILLDGVPMNKAAGGSVNWNLIEPYEIEEIEIVKGPGSAIYGNNAMSGVVSINTKKPDKPLVGNVSTFGGSLGTFGGAFNIGGIDLYKGKGVYWKLNGFTRKGNGYINEPEETRDSLGSKVNLIEYSAGLLGGYRFDTATTLDISYRYYNGKFGTGTKIFEEEGSLDHYSNHLLQSGFDAQLGKYKINTRLYYQLENFYRQNEGMNSTGKYKLSDTRTTKHDYGLWFNISRTFFRYHLLTTGLEIKQGDMDADQIYRTSTDDVRYGGQLAFAGIFIQDEFRLFRKLSVIAGLRFDYAVFSNGFLDVYNPTSNTGFIKDVSDNFENYSWSQFSPKLALQYQVHHNVGIYASVSTGFMPPKIDDLVRSGKISKGFKLANPELKPESLINYELGLTWMPDNKVSIEPSVYYSRGHDFQYFVATGDSVETGSANLKPVLQRRNITEVEIAGAEITAKWKILTNLVFTANYSINHSRILDFHDPTNEDKDLTGKGLIEVPVSMAYASINWQNKIGNVLFDWQFIGKEWYDDENTQYIKPHHVLNIKLSKKLPTKIGFALTIQNILDDLTVDRKGKLPPGRFIIGELSYGF